MYSTLVTARRKEEIYPPYVKWLAYDSDNNLVAYLGNDGQSVELDAYEEEEVTPEKIVQSLSDLIAERDALRAQLANKPAVDTSAMEKRVMCSFSIRGDDDEFVYGLYSRKDAEALLDRQREKYGKDCITDYAIHEYHIVWKE